IVVVHSPLHAEVLAVVHGIRLRIEALARIEVRRPRRRLIAGSWSNDDVVEIRRDILRKIVERDVVDAGHSVTGMQNGLPLNEAGGWRGDFGSFLEINSLPRTPVAVGIVDIATAGKELDVTRGTKFGAAPL